MAFDGITVAAIVSELNRLLIDGRIFKISQPENDELLLTIKNNKEQYRLLISAGASLPLIYLTDTNKPAPLTAPSFCMLLRKHINNGRIIKIYQPGLERIINFEIEHLNEMGDLCKKTLIIELMGKHSNIIFCEDNRIIDSIKHVNFQMSSVREVLPGRDYFIPKADEKLNPLNCTRESFTEAVFQKNLPVSKAVYTSLTGISPIVAEDILSISGIDSDLPANTLNDSEQLHLYHIFFQYMEEMVSGNFTPVIYYKNRIPKDFSAIPLTVYSDLERKTFPSISMVLEQYYSEKNAATRIKQRSADLRQIVSSALSKNYKKYDLQRKQLKNTEKRDKYRIYGELLTTYGYSSKAGDKTLHCTNYYDNTEITIPLDTELEPMENAKKYFDKYGKLKRTYEALSQIVLETRQEIEHLESISTALDIATNENDLKALKEELVQYGYIRRKSGDKKLKFTNKPMHFIVDDTTQIYIGKNNYQNEEVTFKIATGNDWWFHAKGIPGSHVIVKCSLEELPDSAFELAGTLAAYYSKGREMDKVEIDYIQKKHVKKVNGGAPGFVIYHTNYSMVCTPASPDQLGLISEK